MVFYFDTEFTGLHKNTTLISIGIVTSKNNTFYAELTDYDESQINPWIDENVIDNLLMKDNEAYPEGYISNSLFDTNVMCKGNTKFVRAKLLEWLNIKRRNENVNFVSDVSHYDFVLLIDLLTESGSALDLPDYISAACKDINDDITREFSCSIKEAFDMNREKILSTLINLLKRYSIYHLNIGVNPSDELKHNSLYDARIIRAISLLFNIVDTTMLNLIIKIESKMNDEELTELSKYAIGKADISDLTEE